MGLLIYTTNPYALLAIGFCLGVGTGIAAMRAVIKARREH